jgi:hypothetical protein
MKTALFLFCLALAVNAHAQSPKVAFVGDQFTYAWQQSAAFKANPNWIGAGTSSNCCLYGTSIYVSTAFPAVLAKHPDYVFVETGNSDLVEGNSAATRWGMQFEDVAEGLISIVQAAKKANVKIIIANIYDDFTNTWIQGFAQNENIPVVNFGDALSKACYKGYQPSQPGIAPPPPCAVFANGSSPADGGPFSITVPNDAGFQIVTQLAQAAIATYSLKIKGGYLGDYLIYSGDNDYNTYPPSRTSVNTVAPGATVQFTPQATWTDGVTRPMTNVPYGGVLGTWSSSNPKIMTVDQQGFAYAYTPGTATIHFTSTTGQVFSPWGMSVSQWYGNFVPAPIY